MRRFICKFWLQQTVDVCLSLEHIGIVRFSGKTKDVHELKSYGRSEAKERCQYGRTHSNRSYCLVESDFTRDLRGWGEARRKTHM